MYGTPSLGVEVSFPKCCAFVLGVLFFVLGEEVHVDSFAEGTLLPDARSDGRGASFQGRCGNRAFYLQGDYLACGFLIFFLHVLEILYEMGFGRRVQGLRPPV